MIGSPSSKKQKLDTEQESQVEESIPEESTQKFNATQALEEEEEEDAEEVDKKEEDTEQDAKKEEEEPKYGKWIVAIARPAYEDDDMLEHPIITIHPTKEDARKFRAANALQRMIESVFDGDMLNESNTDIPEQWTPELREIFKRFYKKPESGAHPYNAEDYKVEEIGSLTEEQIQAMIELVMHVNDACMTSIGYMYAGFVPYASPPKEGEEEKEACVVAISESMIDGQEQLSVPRFTLHSNMDYAVSAMNAEIVRAFIECVNKREILTNKRAQKILGKGIWEDEYKPLIERFYDESTKDVKASELATIGHLDEVDANAMRDFIFMDDEASSGFFTAEKCPIVAWNDKIVQ